MPGVHHADVSLGSVNLSVPLPTVEVRHLAVAAPAGSGYAGGWWERRPSPAVAAPRAQVPHLSGLVANVLSSLDALGAHNLSLSQALGLMAERLPGWGDGALPAAGGAPRNATSLQELARAFAQLPLFSTPDQAGAGPAAGGSQGGTAGRPGKALREQGLKAKHPVRGFPVASRPAH